MSHDDALTLGGQSFYITGPVRANAVAEWTTGLKVGKATYDERLHAFWLVLDDFSGGIGYRRLDIREALGTAWDNPDGVDIRRRSHVTLPPPKTSTAITAPGAVDYTGRIALRPITSTTVGGLATIAGYGNTIYRATDGITFTVADTITNAKMVSAIVQFTDTAGTAALYAFCEGTSGTARYQRSTDGLTWIDGGTGTQKVVEDGIVWDEKIIGTRPGTGGAGEIIFSTDGRTWNIDDVNDAEVIWRAPYGRIAFLGAYPAPWGAEAVHFLATNERGQVALFVLDFYARKAYEIPLGINISLQGGCIFQSYIAITDGYNVYLWDGMTVRNITWPRKGPLPPALQDGTFTKLVAVGDYLYALFEDTANNCQLYCYTGTGWTPLAPVEATFEAPAFGVAARDLPILATTGRYLLAFGSTSYSGVTSPRRVCWTLPQNGEAPTYGLDSFHAGPLKFHTGWIDGGFMELSGALYRLYCDGWNLSADETVTVGYRLNNSESASFTALTAFTAAGQSVNFSGATGLEFRTVQFEITLTRGGTATRSPELISLVLLYDKKPAFRSTWIFRIDVNRMKEMGTLIDGNAATLQRVWEKLIALWNTKTLIELNVPSIDTSVYVKLADMPTTFDDFRAAVAGQGYAEITVIEPI